MFSKGDLGLKPCEINPSFLIVGKGSAALLRKYSDIVFIVVRSDVNRNVTELDGRPGSGEGRLTSLFIHPHDSDDSVDQRCSRPAIGAHLPVTTFHGGGAIRVPAGPTVLSFYLCVKWLLLHRLPLWRGGCRWACIKEPRVVHYGRCNCENPISLPKLPAADTPHGSEAPTRIITAATTAAPPPHLP